jgi:hypothetical protein
MAESTYSEVPLLLTVLLVAFPISMMLAVWSSIAAIRIWDWVEERLSRRG